MERERSPRLGGGAARARRDRSGPGAAEVLLGGRRHRRGSRRSLGRGPGRDLRLHVRLALVPHRPVGAGLGRRRRAAALLRHRAAPTPAGRPGPRAGRVGGLRRRGDPVAVLGHGQCAAGLGGRCRHVAPVERQRAAQRDGQALQPVRRRPSLAGVAARRDRPQRGLPGHHVRPRRRVPAAGLCGLLRRDQGRRPGQPARCAAHLRARARARVQPAALLAEERGLPARLARSQRWPGRPVLDELPLAVRAAASGARRRAGLLGRVPVPVHDQRAGPPAARLLPGRRHERPPVRLGRCGGRRGPRGLRRAPRRPVRPRAGAAGQVGVRLRRARGGGDQAQRHRPAGHGHPRLPAPQRRAGLHRGPAALRTDRALTRGDRRSTTAPTSGSAGTATSSSSRAGTPSARSTPAATGPACSPPSRSCGSAGH
jgi:hypothetical protein